MNKHLYGISLEKKAEFLPKNAHDLNLDEDFVAGLLGGFAVLGTAYNLVKGGFSATSGYCKGCGNGYNE